jgi:purine-cytosine permease-like protein
VGNHGFPTLAGLRAVTPDATRLGRRQAARRRTWPRVVGALVAAIVLFALGVALGLALDDRPVPGGTQTFVRSLEPITQTSP